MRWTTTPLKVKKQTALKDAQTMRVTVARESSVDDSSYIKDFFPRREGIIINPSRADR